MRNLFMATTAAAVIMGLSSALAQETVSMNISTWLPPNHPVNKQLELWSASLEEASNNTIETTIYPAQQLGAAADHYEMARDGLADMTLVSPSYTPGQFPIFAFVELPFTFANNRGGSRGFDEWYRQYTDVEMPDVRYCNLAMHHTGTFHFTREIRTPDQLQGLRIRPAGTTIANWVSQLGASTVQASAVEVRELAERGVIDGVSFPWDLLGAQSALQHHIDHPMYISASAFVLSPNFYDNLSDEQKAAVDSHCTSEWSQRISEGWAAGDADIRETYLSSSDQNVYELTEEEASAWVESADPIRKSVYESVERYGLEGAKLADELEQLLEKHDAKY